MKKKNTKVICRKSLTFLSAAILAAALVSGQALPAVAEGYDTKVESWTLIPDNVTIEEPTELYNVSLPDSEYGSLYWANESYVPTQRTESCKVIFEPYEGVDLSGLSGWDSEEGVLIGYITVVVNNPETDYESDSDYDEEYDYEEDSYEEDSYEEEIEEEEPASTEEPEVTETPTSAEEPETTGTPAPTEEVEATGTPTPAEEPEATGTPAPTEEAEATGTPAPTEGAEATGTPAPTEGAEATETPAPTEGAEATETPAPTEEVQPTETPAPSEEAEPTEAPAPSEEPENIFDEVDIQPEERPEQPVNEEELTEEEIRGYAQSNHSCAGISVSGIELPWYVQFRVSGGENYEYTNEDTAEIFRSYEFELWDTKNNTEYKIPDGEYISVTLPVKAGYEYTVEHHLDNGAMETIIPSVEGGTMVFSTHSFSPFGIAGSRPIVGEDVNNIIYPELTPTSAPSVTRAPGATGTPSVTRTPSTAGTGSQGSNSSSAGSSVSSGGSSGSIYSSSSGNTGNTGNRIQSVSTGDYTAILPFVILIAAAAAVIIIIVVVRKKRK